MPAPRDRIRSLGVLLVPLLLLVVWAVACVTSPTGRSQLIMLPETQLAEMGQTAFAEMKSETPVAAATSPATTYVRCVAKAITDMLTADEMRGLAVTRWEVEVFEDPTANAFALPGGKIGVHTGLLEVARTPGQLATVVAHEVGHVLARHGNERVSQSTLAQSGLAMAQILAGAPSQEKQQLLGLLGVGVQFGILMPYGRSQESEADEIGLELMARAGFDPRESVRLWENMESAAGGAAPPELLSTHPSHGTRISRLQAKMSEAMATYEAARSAGRSPQCRPS